jgi:tripartite ATP-independent transporter DctM subunit
MEILLFIGLMIALIALGMPIAFALIATGGLGIYVTLGFPAMVSQLSGTAYRSAANSSLAAIPLFILMAEFMNSGGMARDVFDAARKWVGRLPGGLSIATVLAAAGFASVSGSSTAAAGTLGSISLPEFKRLGYSLPVATGVVAVAGTLSVMIPPSIAFIVYGIMTESSIGKLLIAGIVPGILTGLLYVVGIILQAKLFPDSQPNGERFSWLEKWQATKSIFGFLVIVAIVFVSLYGGIATTTETAAIGAFSAFIYITLTGRMSVEGFKNALLRSIRVSTMIFLIVMGALVFGYYLTISRAPYQLLQWIGGSGLENWQILSMILLLYLVLGFFMEQLAILLITLPLTFPVVSELGYDPIWFGVVVVKLVEIGLITPPMGLNVFVVSATTGVPVAQVFRGTGYLLIFEIITLVIIVAFPALTLWLPSQM